MSCRRFAVADTRIDTAGATAIVKDDTLAFPEAAKPGQMIKLPGQTRVTPDEYHEFITLGQGGVYELDLERCVLLWKTKRLVGLRHRLVLEGTIARTIICCVAPDVGRIQHGQVLATREAHV